MGGTEIVGAFTMIQKLINVPVNLISQVMRPLLISESYKGDEHLYKLIKKALKLLLLPIPLGIALIFLYKDFMVGILLGKKWVDYSYLLLIYMPYASVLFLVNWMDRLYDIQYEMRWASAYEVINAFISLIIISVAFNIFNDNLTPIFLYSLALGLFNIFYLWKSIKIVSGSVREIFQHFVFAFLTVCGSLFIITKYISDFKLSWYEIFPLFVLWCVVLIFSAKKIIRSDEITR
jgi:O-antigen/teichoic acid export membrane protein